MLRTLLGRSSPESASSSSAAVVEARIVIFRLSLGSPGKTLELSVLPASQTCSCSISRPYVFHFQGPLLPRNGWESKGLSQGERTSGGFAWSFFGLRDLFHFCKTNPGLLREWFRCSLTVIYDWKMLAFLPDPDLLSLFHFVQTVIHTELSVDTCYTVQPDARTR